MRIAPWGWFVVMALTGLVAGCNRVVEVGKPFAFPKEKNTMLFGVKSFSESAITNQDATPVAGVILHDASLIESHRELAGSKHQLYVIFQGFMLGEGAKSRYWQQQSQKRVGLGSPDMEAQYSKVVVVEVDSNRVVIGCKSLRAAHVTLSVDTNDFVKTFKP